MKRLIVLLVLCVLALVGATAAVAVLQSDVQTDLTTDSNSDIGTFDHAMTPTEQQQITDVANEVIGNGTTLQVDGTDTDDYILPDCVVSPGHFCPDAPLLSGSTPSGECLTGILLRPIPTVDATYHFGYIYNKSEVKCEAYYPVSIATGECILREPNDFRSGTNLRFKPVKCSGIIRGIDITRAHMKYGCSYTTADYEWRVGKMVILNYLGGNTILRLFRSRVKYTNWCQ